MPIRIFSIMVAVLATIFGLIGMPILIYADLEAEGEINVSALVPSGEEEVPPPVGGRPAFIPDTVPPQIFDIVVDNITSDSAVISWKTSEPSIPQINYGKTKDYEKTIIGKDFLTSHKIILENLLADTIYHFEIVVADRSGNRTSSGDYVFKILVGPDILAPANISNFEAVPKDGQITLKWQNPTDPDFKAVRIMRSEDFYPQDPEQGTLVYDNKETSFIDAGLTNGKRYYYTAFSYDFSENFSSGAIVSAVPRLAMPPPPEGIFTEKECLEAGYYWYDKTCHIEPKIIPPPPEVERITIDDFDFIQAGRKIPIIDGKLEIKKEEQLKILINYDKVPEVLKTITVTLEKPASQSLGGGEDKKFFSFLLRINKEKTAYLATLMLPDEPGIYPITITVLDYKNQALKKINAFLEAFGIPTVSAPVPWYKNWLNWAYIIITLFILTCMMFFIRKGKNKLSK